MRKVNAITNELFIVHVRTFHIFFPPLISTRSVWMKPFVTLPINSRETPERKTWLNWHLNITCERRIKIAYIRKVISYKSFECWSSAYEKVLRDWLHVHMYTYVLFPHVRECNNNIRLMYWNSKSTISAISALRIFTSRNEDIRVAYVHKLCEVIEKFIAVNIESRWQEPYITRKRFNNWFANKMLSFVMW